MHILAFAASPRRGGNSDVLLEAVLSDLRDGNVECELFHLDSLDIAPCNGCGHCEREFRCTIEDDFDRIAKAFIRCDGVVFSSPLYFMNVPARSKAFIDRCQIFWSVKYRLGEDVFQGKKRFGLYLACGGAKKGIGGTSLFRGFEDTMAVLFDALGLTQLDGLTVTDVEEKGALAKRNDILDKAYDIGRDMAGLVFHNV
ncbi:flavodoxin family protein [Candidatus Latescibacterota bacterium]